MSIRARDQITPDQWSLAERRLDVLDQYADAKEEYDMTIQLHARSQNMMKSYDKDEPGYLEHLSDRDRHYDRTAVLAPLLDKLYAEDESITLQLGGREEADEISAAVDHWIDFDSKNPKAVPDIPKEILEEIKKVTDHVNLLDEEVKNAEENIEIAHENHESEAVIGALEDYRDAVKDQADQIHSRLESYTSQTMADFPMSLSLPDRAAGKNWFSGLKDFVLGQTDGAPEPMSLESSDIIDTQFGRFVAIKKGTGFEYLPLSSTYLHKDEYITAGYVKKPDGNFAEVRIKPKSRVHEIPISTLTIPSKEAKSFSPKGEWKGYKQASSLKAQRKGLKHKRGIAAGKGEVRATQPALVANTNNV